MVAASAGNHAQGVALAAQELGIRATIFMPLGVPRAEASRRRAATAPTSCCEGADRRDAAAAAAEFAETTGAVFIQPFDHPDVIAGPGHARARDPREVPDVDTIVRRRSAAAGSSPASPRRPSARGARRAATVRIIGVQAENSAAYPSSLAAGQPARGRDRARRSPTASPSPGPGELNFEIIRELRRRGRHRHRGRHRPRPARAARAREAGRRAGRRRRGRGDPRRQDHRDGPTVTVLSRRQHRPAAACSASSRTGSRHPVATSRCASRCPTAPVSSRACRSCSPRRARTSSRCCTPATVRGCRSARSILQLQRRDARRGAPRSTSSPVLGERRATRRPVCRRTDASVAAARRAGSALLTVVGLDLDDLDGDLPAVRSGVGGLLALLAADDRGAERRCLAVDVELGADGDLAVAEQEDLFVAGDDRRDDGAGLDDAGALRAPRRPSAVFSRCCERADAGLLLALLVLGGVVAAVLLEVALFARGFDPLGDLLAAGRRELLELVRRGGRRRPG